MSTGSRKGTQVAKKIFTPKFDLVTLITVVIVVAWVTAYIAEYVSPSFEAPSGLDPLMFLVASVYITKNTVEGKSKDDSSDEKPKDDTTSSKGEKS